MLAVFTDSCGGIFMKRIKFAMLFGCALFAAMLLGHLSISATAQDAQQQSVPSDTVLHAGYCLGMLTAADKQFTDTCAQASQTDKAAPNGQQRSITKDVEPICDATNGQLGQIREAKRRTMLYLGAKNMLGANATGWTTLQGSQDLNLEMDSMTGAEDKCTVTCFAKNKSSNAAETCVEQTCWPPHVRESVMRFRKCLSGDYLPY